MICPCKACGADKRLRFEGGRATSCRAGCEQYAAFDAQIQKLRQERELKRQGARSGAAMDRIWMNKLENRYGKR